MGRNDSYSRRGFLETVGLTGGLALATGSSAAMSGEQPTPVRDVTVYEDITYAERPEGTLELDLYLPETDEPSPLVVWIHGGGWLVNTRKSSPDLRRYFASRGYAMATISHRLSEIPEGIDPVISPDPDNPTPRATFPAHIVDVKAAIRWLRAHADEYGLDPANVAVWGSSSGAHLATLAGTAADVTEIAGDVYPDETVEKTVAPDRSGRVQAVIARYPPTDFLLMDEQLDGEGFPHNAPNSPESLLVGGQITEHEDRVERANPLTYVSPDDPPFLISHGRADTTVPYEQSVLLYDALRDACVDATFYELPELGHGYGFDELAAKPVIDQTVRTTRSCNRSRGAGSQPADRTTSGPPIGPTVVERFLARHLAR